MIATGLSFALLTLCAPAPPNPKPKPAAELLPETPPNWRFERIDFPLPFAPDLKYDGFEELRFAPGMFNTKSDTYFTYIFALKITNDVAIDAVLLKSLLETYYRGLCRSVAEGTDFKIDVAKISAAVRVEHAETQHARFFRATLDSFDPFVTGKPIKLHLEMVVADVSQTDHRIFAAVSPAPTQSPVWKMLRMLKRGFYVSIAQGAK